MPSSITAIKFAPDPDNVVNLQEYFGYTSSYTVPTGKDLILTDWSADSGTPVSSYWVYVNGAVVWHLNTPWPTTQYVSSHGSWESGLVAHAGNTVDLRAELAGAVTLVAYAAGYLVDQPTPQFTVRLRFIPDSGDVVQVDSSSGAYTVPQGHNLIMTDWSAGDSGASAYAVGLKILVNGNSVWEVSDWLLSAGNIRAGVAAHAGDVVTLIPRGPSAPDGHVIGFLRRQ